MAELLEAVMWRLILWMVRLLRLPVLVVGFVYYVALPAASGLTQALLTPGGLLIGLLLLLWMRRR